MQNNKTTTRIFLFCSQAVVLMAGLWMYIPKAKQDGLFRIFSSPGDGFFNLWVMEHVVQNMLRGTAAVFDGRIFWPSNQYTLLWSDNLLFPSLVYRICKLLSVNMLSAYWLTSVVLFLFGFIAFAVLFYRCWCIYHPEERWNSTLILVPVFTFFASFSCGRLAFFAHFQNLSSYGIILLVLGVITNLQPAEKRKGLRLILVSEVLLLYSAPYFAVMGICLILPWFVMRYLQGRSELIRELWRQKGWILVSGTLYGALAFAYSHISPPLHGLPFLHDMSAGVIDIYSSFHPQVASLISSFADVREVDSERLAYVGLGALIGGLMLVGYTVFRLRYILKKWWFWLLLLFGASTLLNARELLPVTCWIGVLFWLALLLILCRIGSLRPFRHSAVSAMAYLLAACLICYGIAFGPSPLFFDEHVNGTIWGLFALLVKPVVHLRAIGRFALVGHGLLLCLLFMGTQFVLQQSFSRRVRSLWWFIILFLAGVQIWEQKDLQPNSFKNNVRPDSCAALDTLS